MGAIYQEQILAIFLGRFVLLSHRTDSNVSLPTRYSVLRFLFHSKTMFKAHVATSSIQEKYKSVCTLCRKEPYFYRICPQFKTLSFKKRFEIVKKGCCINCLSLGHSVKNCSSSHNFNICKSRHPTLLHRPNSLASSRPSNF